MEKFFLFLFGAMLLGGNSALAQSLYVFGESEPASRVALNEIRSLTFSEDRVYINKKDNTVSEFVIDGVRRMEVKTDPDTGNEMASMTGQEVRAFPNPVEDRLFVESFAIIEQVCLFNMSGSLILRESFDVRQVKLSLASLPAGVYCLKVITATGSYSKIISKK